MTLDELLLEWSYRSERGYPTVDNPSDVLLLKEILTQLKLSEQEVEDIIDNLPDEPGGDDITISGTDGMEGSSVEDKNEKEVQSNPKLEPEPEAESGLTSYDKVIKKELESQGLWEGSMPIPKGNYKWSGEFGGTFDEQVANSDIKLWTIMFPLAPPKKGDPDSSSKGVGNGELALYWLYKYSGTVNVTEGREGDNPDLEFGGVGVEVKAYDSQKEKQG